MTRTLQNRLALANVKIKHGWQNMSLDTLEPKVDVELKRKRPGSSNEAMSDASSVSERFYNASMLDSSPLAAPIFSDDVRRSVSRGSHSGSSHSHSKRARYAPPPQPQPYQQHRYPGTSNHNRVKVRPSSGHSQTWKSMHRLAESSPAYRRRRNHYGSSQHAPTLSFVSEASTIPDDQSPFVSDDDEEDLPITSFQLRSSHLRSSPPPRAPRTPPPVGSRSTRHRGVNREGKEDDANLLMYLATSPSPAQPSSRTLMPAPSTPPQKHTPLPSSMMSTPGGQNSLFPAFGLATPNANVNFADFLNMTPSPAQLGGSWNRTPAGGKTPAAARIARRQLDFDKLLPPGATDSPRMGERPKGLGMDLGGELSVP